MGPPAPSYPGDGTPRSVLPGPACCRDGSLSVCLPQRQIPGPGRLPGALNLCSVDFVSRGLSTYSRCH
eukprot:227743-Chlamydomonas_euryale.AAC.2